MNRILTCTDGSSYAPSVYDHSAWAARRCGASVHVLHMIDPQREPGSFFDLSGNLGPDTGKGLLEEIVRVEESRNRLARERGKNILAIAREHLESAGVTHVTVEQLHGTLVEVVTEMEERADLVVLGKRGESADFAKLHLGSSLERVIRASRRPILVASRKFTPIDRFLIAYDGGPSVERALRFVIEDPLLREIPCEILRAGKIDDKAKWYLEEAAAKLREAGFEVNVRAVGGEPEDVISTVIREEKIPLLVMGAYGHSRIRQFILGSTTTEMIRTCQVPVLLFQ